MSPGPGSVDRGSAGPGSAGPGLTRVSLPDLQRLQRLLETGRLGAPLDPTALQATGLGYLWPALQRYAVLDATALVLLLQAVEAERTQRPVPHLELVWTGPDPLASRARDTSVVVRELFESAQRSVLVAGYSFDHAAEILSPLHRAMRDRGVEASLFVDLSGYANPHVPGDPAQAAADLFLARNWPFGDPRPTLYYDPKNADRATRISLHAKCVVVDEERTLITSANFTDRGQTRNVETGVLIDDSAFARIVAEHWRALVQARAFSTM